MNFLKSIFCIALVSFVMNFQTTAQVIVVKKPQRPNVRVVKPRCPGKANKYVWVSGHWVWNKRNRVYVWRKGYWMKKQRNRRYVAGHWDQKRNGYVWVPGHWRRT